MNLGPTGVNDKHGRLIHGGDTICVTREELNRHIPENVLLIGGKPVADLPLEAEVRFRKQDSGYEASFWATEHISFDVPLRQLRELELLRVHLSRPE